MPWSLVHSAGHSQRVGCPTTQRGLALLSTRIRITNSFPPIPAGLYQRAAPIDRFAAFLFVTNPLREIHFQSMPIVGRARRPTPSIKNLFIAHAITRQQLKAILKSF
jgi:hypothetical protein